MYRTEFITVRGYSKSTAVVCVLSSGANAWGVRTWRRVPDETAAVITKRFYGDFLVPVLLGRVARTICLVPSAHGATQVRRHMDELEIRM